MYVIVGLGNPGLKYATTRHNIGFEVVERLAYDHQIEINKKKFKSLIGEGRIGTEKVLIVQPQTYMNRSGEAVRAIMDFYKISNENIIVVYDDISLDVGQIRLRRKGSAGGHNGIKDIIAQLGTDNFPRVKVGVGNKPPGWDLANYVLGQFSKEEILKMSKMAKVSADATECIIKEGMQKAMNDYNSNKRWDE